MKLPILFGLFSVVFGQQLINFKAFEGGNKQNLINANPPYSVFLSASSDDENLLKNINLVSGNDTISFYDLKNRKIFAHNITQLQPYTVTNSAYVTSSLSTFQFASLTGVMYITTSKQATAAAFYIVDVTDAQTISKYNNADVVTIVFLNTNTAKTPYQSTMFSQWNQYAEDIFLYSGAPKDSDESNNTQIFSNPVLTPNGWDLHGTVEKFSVQLTAFYMKAYMNGGMSLINFRIEQGYVDIQNTFTSAPSTTGFYMKPYGDADSNITVKSRSNDDQYYGYIGGNIVGSVPNGAVVSLALQYDGARFANPITPTDVFTPWSTPETRGYIQITSRGAQNGQFYVQYYVIQKLRNPTQPPQTQPTLGPTTSGQMTSVVPTTSKIIETTTQSAGKLFSVISILMLLGFVL